MAVILYTLIHILQVGVCHTHKVIVMNDIPTHLLTIVFIHYWLHRACKYFYTPTRLDMMLQILKLHQHYGKTYCRGIV